MIKWQAISREVRPVWARDRKFTLQDLQEMPVTDGRIRLHLLYLHRELVRLIEKGRRIVRKSHSGIA
jgi:hypothetical protein